jgi:hypothetical protein
MNVNLDGVVAAVRTVWEELVERRLWPLALALVVGIVAIPVVLSKPANKAAPPVPPASATGSGSPAAAFQPAISTEGLKSSQIHKNLGRFPRKNPFTPQGVNLSSTSGAASPTSTASSTSATSTSTSASTGSSPPTSASGGSSGSTTTSTPSVPKTTSKTFYYTYTVDVKFGKTGQEDEKKLTEFRALPGSDNPVIVFMGVRPDGKTAVFLVSANASTTGNGTCKPSDTECTFLYMKKGDKKTIEATNVDQSITDYTLELLHVDLKRTDAPSKASASKQSRAVARRQARARFTRIDRSIQALGL